MSGLDLDPPVCHGDHLLEALTILVEGSTCLGDVGDEGVVELGVQLLIQLCWFFLRSLLSVVWEKGSPDQHWGFSSFWFRPSASSSPQRWPSSLCG